MVATGDGGRNSAAGTASPAALRFSADQAATGPASWRSRNDVPVRIQE